MSNSKFTRYLVDVKDKRLLNDVLFKFKEELEFKTISPSGIISYLFNDYLEKCREGNTEDIDQKIIKYMMENDKRRSSNHK